MTERILVVDDEPEVVSMLALALKRAGFESETVLSGEAALQRALVAPPAAVVLDIMMPGLDGYEVARRLRAQPETATIPIIVLTARALVPDQIRAMQAGATHYMAKPILPSTLIEKLRQLLAARASYSETLANGQM
jgi:DNA-binding response OmpR family regulator